VPVTVSYPGVYIEELASSNHTVVPAPTSVTVFVGYTNPFWTLAPDGTLPPFGQAVELFSFGEYEASFGGLFTWPWLPDHVGQAVSQFFQNGGSHAYVIALEATSYLVEGSPPATIAAATLALPSGGAGLVLTARQPAGVASMPPQGIAMTVTISNLTKGAADNDTADITIVYGTRVETYRRVPISALAATLNARSSLLSASGTAPADYSALAGTAPLAYATPPPDGATTIDPTGFAAVFAANAPLDKVSIFNLMVLPGISDPAVLAEALAYCEAKRAFFIMDPPATAVADALAAHVPGAPANPAPIGDIVKGAAANTPATPAPPTSPNGALYFPYLQISDPVTGAPSSAPPSGFVAGVFAREDSNRGVWKSPAGLEATISGTTGVVASGAMTDPQQGALNPLGVNCIRQFPGVGSVVFGARTLVAANVAFQQWWYVAVRRTALFIEQSLYASLKWAIFEPNDTPLWNALTQEVTAFMLGLYRQGAFQGSADQAFKVKCDATTTTQADIDNGIVNLLVGFAPLKPAEFVVVQIAQLAGQTQS
jgi:phage tail sheath protein FI